MAPHAGGLEAEGGARLGEDTIWRLAIALTGAAASEDVATAVAHEQASAAGPIFASLATLDERTMRLQVVHDPHLPLAALTRWTDVSIGEATPMCEAAREGSPVLLPDRAAIATRFPLVVDDSARAGLVAVARLSRCMTRRAERSEPSASCGPRHTFQEAFLPASLPAGEHLINDMCLFGVRLA